MKSHLNKIKALGAISLLVLFAACENETAPSLFDPNVTSNPAPVINNLSPASGSLAGVGVVTIAGANFASNKADNFVYFDKLSAEVLEASPTQLKVKAPVLVKDSIQVRLAVSKAEKFSNTMLYKLEAAVSEPVKFQSFEEPWGIACDANGEVYVSMVVNALAAGVKKIVAGKLNDYAPRGTELKYSAMKFGPGGVIYAARIVRAVFQIPAAGAAPAVFVSSANGMDGTIYDLDFDAGKNIWAAGNNDFIYRVKLDKNTKRFAFRANVRSVRVFDNYLYLAGNRDGLEKVWRLRLLSADSLGAEEEYFNYSATPAGARGTGVFAITFASDGDMYLGTDASEAIFVVHPNKTFEPLYPGLFVPKSLVFAWGKGTELYVTRERFGSAAQTLVKINTQKTSAPYYGRQ